MDLVMSGGEAVYGGITDNWPTLEPWFNETGYVAELSPQGRKIDDVTQWLYLNHEFRVAEVIGWEWLEGQLAHQCLCRTQGRISWNNPMIL